MTFFLAKTDQLYGGSSLTDSIRTTTEMESRELSP